MDEQTQALFDAALALSSTQRAHLIRNLMQSLPSEMEEAVDQELAEELDRRFAEWEDGKASPVPWAELRSLE